MSMFCMSVPSAAREGATDAAVVADSTWDLEAEVASFQYAPPMTERKFKTMQDRRVPVSIKCEFSM